ncbi:TolC family protein [Duganella vulcania]|uniref:Protein CyaE n=1 Tax=Duganella vulcania TaxID=2692166 RepID=A0A845GPK5_9BURK|nr:TolC family protein [Duganella vulcania]MYM95196.1 TolC family protein [Duganella vulcania]
MFSDFVSKNELPVDCGIAQKIPDILELVDAVKIAICNNKRIKGSWAAVEEQRAALEESKSSYLPTASVSVNKLRTHAQYPDHSSSSASSSGSTISGSLNWRVFDFGARDSTIKTSEQILVSAEFEHDSELQKIVSNTMQCFFDGQSAAAVLKAKIQDSRISSETLESAKRREISGVSSRSDTLQMATANAKANLELSRAKGNYGKAIGSLNYAMGVPLHSSYKLIDFEEMSLAPSAMASWIANENSNLVEWINKAELKHPAILAAKARFEAAQEKINVVKAEGNPTIDFSINYYQNGYPGQALSSTRSRVGTIGLTINFPIFDGFSRSFKVKQAIAQKERKDSEMRDISQSISAEVLRSYYDALSSLKNINETQVLLEAAQEAYTVSKRKYEKGVADVVEILNTQNSLVDAEEERVRAIAEWRSAQLRLIASSGILSFKSLNKIVINSADY